MKIGRWLYGSALVSDFVLIRACWLSLTYHRFWANEVLSKSGKICNFDLFPFQTSVSLLNLTPSTIQYLSFYDFFVKLNIAIIWLFVKSNGSIFPWNWLPMATQYILWKFRKCTFTIWCKKLCEINAFSIKLQCSSIDFNNTSLVSLLIASSKSSSTQAEPMVQISGVTPTGHYDPVFDKRWR